ncbi:hypothetical protein [Streptomyces sp. IBSBF 2435]|uniref:hypothetical protein n=1 Tax=Streptomyces sp. IBSBF 2435 TaxID=2903531 RepID=UPI002FDB96E7
MATTLTPLTIQRLAYVRYLYQEGIEHSRRPSPLSASALLSFHDAVENLLGVAGEHLDVDVKPGTTFLGYWETMKPKYELPGKANMKRLNDNRVALKHSGIFPSAQAIEQARVTVVDFFRVVVPAIFDVDFDRIDMVDLVTIDPVAQTLRDAQTHANLGDLPMALAGLSLAFGQLLDHCVGPAHGPGSSSPFRFGKDLPHFHPLRYSGSSRETWKEPMVVLKDQVGALRAAIPPLRKALQVMSLGIEYARYARFETLTPRIHRDWGARVTFYVDGRHKSLGIDDYQWCRHFVIESALTAVAAEAAMQLREDRSWEDSGRDYLEWNGPAAEPE